jgi:hypothetical protein
MRAKSGFNDSETKHLRLFGTRSSSLRHLYIHVCWRTTRVIPRTRSRTRFIGTAARKLNGFRRLLQHDDDGRTFWLCQICGCIYYTLNHTTTYTIYCVFFFLFISFLNVLFSLRLFCRPLRGNDFHLFRTRPGCKHTVVAVLRSNETIKGQVNVYVHHTLIWYFTIRIRDWLSWHMITDTVFMIYYYHVFFRIFFFS